MLCEQLTSTQTILTMNRLLLFVSFALVLSSCSSSDEFSRERFVERYQPTTAPPISPGLPDTGIVAIGDSVILAVWGVPEFNLRTIVKPNGSISIPLVGQIVASGRTRCDLSDYIKKRLTEFIRGEQTVSVEVVTPLPRITVLGMVARPMSFPATTGLPLLEVMSLAGGWTDQADLRFVKIGRKPSSGMGESVSDINLEANIERGDLQSLPMIQPGDIVIVPKKDSFARDISDFLRDALLFVGFFNLVK